MKNKTKHIIAAIALTLGLSYAANAQVTAQKIGNNPTTIAPSAVLDIESTTKGVLFPRVALTSIIDVITVPSPVNGLTVFNTTAAGSSPNNVIQGYYYWNGSRWTRLATAAEAFARTVFVNATSPNTATIFAETNPPTTNVDALKADAANLYIGNDGSTWTYNPTGAGTYRTYIQPSSTPFNLANSTTDAGNNKTAIIWRTGSMGIGTNNPVSTFSNTSSPINGTNSPNAFNGGLTWSAAGSGFAGSFYSQPTNGNGLLVKIAGSQSSNNALEVSRSTSQDASAAITPLFNVKGNGFVGIGTSNPHTNLDIIGGMSLRTTAGIAGSHTGIEFNTNSNSPRIDWVFGGNYTGSFAGDADSFFRLHNSREGLGGFRFTTNPSGTGVERLTILNNGNVGIGSTMPTSRLEVNGSATNRTSHNAGTSTTIDFSQSNLARTDVNLSSNPTFVLTGIKDGGTYTLRVRSSAAGTANFQTTATGFASTAFRSPNNGVAAAGDTLYTFMVIGDRVFFYMTTGL